MLAEALTLLFTILVALILGSTLIFMLGLNLGVLAAMFYPAIDAIAHAHIRMPHMHLPHGA